MTSDPCTCIGKIRGRLSSQCLPKYCRGNICALWMASLFFLPPTNTFTQLITYYQQVISPQLFFAFKTSKCTTVWEQSYKHFKSALIWLQWSSMLCWTANMYGFNNNKWHFKTLKQSLKNASWVMSPLIHFMQCTIRSIHWSLITMLQ